MDLGVWGRVRGGGGMPLPRLGWGIERIADVLLPLPRGLTIKEE